MTGLIVQNSENEYGMNEHVCVKLIAFLEVGKGGEGNPRISDNGRH